MSDIQYSFRLGKSTNVTLVYVKNFVVPYPSKCILEIFLDFESTFCRSYLIVCVVGTSSRS